MKVVLVTAEYPPVPGGVGDYSQRLVESLAELGEEPIVFTSTEPDPERVGTSREAASWRFPQGQKIWYAVPRWTWRAWRLLKGRIRAERPDVVHIQYQAASYGMRPFIHAAPALIRSWGIRPLVVVTFHDLRVPYLFPKAGPLRPIALRALAAPADAVITTNPEDFGAVRRWRGEHVYEIPIGSNVRNCPPPGFSLERWRERHGIAPEERVIVFFGLLNRSKGLAELLAAVDELVRDDAPVRLVIVGGVAGLNDPTNAAYEREVRRRIATLGIAPRVLWLGYQAPEEVSAALLSADVCALPYLDGVSTRRGTLMAALAHGVALLTTRPRIALPQVRDGEHALMAPSADPADLVGPLRLLLADDALRARLRRGAREAARHFTWDAIALRHAALYRALAGDDDDGLIAILAGRSV